MRIVPTVVGALSLLLATWFVALPALAGKVAGIKSVTYKLAPPANAPEPKATGQWTLRRDPWMMTEDGAVSCRNLTPVRQYTVVVLVHWSAWRKIGYEPYPTGSGSDFMELPVATDTRGRLNTQFTVVSDWSSSGGVNRTVQDLWIENSDGSVVLE